MALTNTLKTTETKKETVATTVEECKCTEKDCTCADATCKCDTAAKKETAEKTAPATITTANTTATAATATVETKEKATKEPAKKKEPVAKMKIKWTNKWSHEVGFVKNIDKAKKEFENTFEESKAKKFAKTTVEKTIKQLEEFCDCNTYEAIEA